MCGIVGVIAKSKSGMSNKDIDIFRQLLFANQLRGDDGTGIFYNSKRGKHHIRILKTTSPSSEFINFAEFDKVEKTLFSESNFIIGHNRAATKGELTVECTHPFREQHIILVHNGTLPNHNNLHSDIKVDSHAICHSMANIGEEETFEKIDGAFALVWFNAKTKKLNLCRNYQRPLHIIETHTSYIISSELELAIWIIERNLGTVVKQQKIDTEKIYSFPIEDMSVFEETKVKFKEYSQSVWMGNTYKGQQGTHHYKPQEMTKSTFVFGDKIRFKGGTIRKTHGTDLFMLEGYMLKWPNIPRTSPLFDADFDDKVTIRVIDTEAKLIKFALENKLIGTVERVIHSGENRTYILTNVENYNNVKSTPPIVIVATKEQTCEWCTSSYTVDSTIPGVCQQCVEIANGYGMGG